MEEIGRAKGIDDEVEFRGAIGLFGNFKMQWALTNVRTLGGGRFAIGRAGVDVAILSGRCDVELPGRTEEFESVHGARIPVCGVGERDLSVADHHGDVGGPSRRGAGNFCRLRGYVRKRNGVCGVSAEIDGGRVEDVLDVVAEPIFALGVCRHWKQEEQTKEEVSVFAFHIKNEAGRDGVFLILAYSAN